MIRILLVNSLLLKQLFFLEINTVHREEVKRLKRSVKQD